MGRDGRVSGGFEVCRLFVCRLGLPESFQLQNHDSKLLLSDTKLFKP
jgi:hypothetical protein